MVPGAILKGKTCNAFHYAHALKLWRTICWGTDSPREPKVGPQLRLLQDQRQLGFT